MTKQDRIVVLEDNHRLRAENDTLRRERDEARRRVCSELLKRGVVFLRIGAKSVAVTKVSEVAKMMDWDCFQEETRNA
jgi:hypothetical protein